jgi:hypothetical protein
MGTVSQGSRVGVAVGIGVGGKGVGVSVGGTGVNVGEGVFVGVGVGKGVLVKVGVGIGVAVGVGGTVVGVSVGIITFGGQPADMAITERMARKTKALLNIPPPFHLLITLTLLNLCCIPAHLKVQKRSGQHLTGSLNGHSAVLTPSVCARELLKCVGERGEN